MGDVNKAPNDFFDNWNNIKSMSYRNVIQLHVRGNNEDKIMKATQFEIEQFPEKTQKDLTVSESNLFYLGLSGLFKDSNWWSKASVTDACSFYLSCARNFIPYFENYSKEDGDLSQKEKNEIFSLYQLCTLFISWNAIREKEIRKVIGIRKSLLFR